MAATSVAKALVRKYEELLGELSVVERPSERTTRLYDWDDVAWEIERRQKELSASLDHLKHVIRLFDPTWREEAAKSRPPRRRFVSERGAVVRRVFDVLRRHGQPMTARQIAKAMFDDADRPAEEVLSKIEINVRAAMARAVRRGLAVRVPGPKLTWSLASEPEDPSAPEHVPLGGGSGA